MKRQKQCKLMTERKICMSYWHRLRILLDHTLMKYWKVLRKKKQQIAFNIFQIKAMNNLSCGIFTKFQKSK
ncbi:unnamed protein product [Paramecium octaurelia]|uniref:Uncharacterized protein n=1 Tax=Paramecium octaurelia TaxID=43137 RepID=A0A8S1YMM3_PAROT|nr:unnamed protein product [Paramecium octaurelia]